MFSVRREQGRLAELAPVIRILAGEGRTRRAVAARARRAARRARHGGGGEARARGASPPTGSTRSARRSGSPRSRTSTDACTALGDEATAALVYPELEPLAGANVMIGHLVSCYGAADRYLGMLAATLGESERAEEHFERALELNRRMGAATWLAHTAYEYGRFLLATRPRARERRAARRGRVARRAHRHADAARTDPGARHRRRRRAALPDGLSPREAQILALVARGLSNREIGKALTISEHTAANHVRSILRKTRLREPHRGRVLRSSAPARVCLTCAAALRSADAALHDRAHVRGSARPHGRRHQR